MKLVDMKVSEYLSALGSDSPAPGGGSASALCGAQGAALVAMAAALTLGRKKYAEHQELCTEVRDRASELMKKLTAQVDNDTEAYNAVSSAYKLPKETGEDRAARAAAISAAMLTAARVPFHTMELALEGLILAYSIVGRSNVNTSSDLGVAALNLVCCVDGSWLNVLTNLSDLQPPERAGELRVKGGQISERAHELGGKIMKKITGALAN